MEVLRSLRAIHRESARHFRLEIALAAVMLRDAIGGFFAEAFGELRLVLELHQLQQARIAEIPEERGMRLLIRPGDLLMMKRDVDLLLGRDEKNHATPARTF